jgi:hypothetical protein
MYERAVETPYSAELAFVKTGEGRMAIPSLLGRSVGPFFLNHELNELENYGNIKINAYPAEGTVEHSGKRPDGNRAASAWGLCIPRMESGGMPENGKEN